MVTRYGQLARSAQWRWQFTTRASSHSIFPSGFSPLDTRALNFIAHIRNVTRSFLAVMESGSMVSTAVNRETVKSNLRCNNMRTMQAQAGNDALVI
jgi:hypothetical protein